MSSDTCVQGACDVCKRPMQVPDHAPLRAFWICKVCSGSAIPCEALVLRLPESTLECLRRAYLRDAPRFTAAVGAMQQAGDVRITGPIVLDTDLPMTVTKITIGGQDMTGKIDVMTRADWERWQQVCVATAEE